MSKPMPITKIVDMVETPEILTEKNHKRFRLIKGNRPLIERKVKKIIADYESGTNLFPFCPVLINEEDYVIDGQHRIEACRRLKLIVYYVLVPDLSLVQIAQINAASSNWKVSDYFNCFIESGITEYKTLQFFMDKYSTSLHIAMSLLMEGNCAGGGHGAEKFKSGEFKVLHQKLAEQTMLAVDAYKTLAEFDVAKDRNFVRAIQLLLEGELYKHNDVVSRMKSKKVKIQKKGSWKEFIYHIEELFNKDNSKRQRIYE